MSRESTDIEVSPNAMLTGRDYRASLDDGRDVWYDGQRIEKVSEQLLQAG